MFLFSFWADEAFVSGIASQLILGKLNLLQALNIPGISYQRLYLIVVAMFLKIFGMSEFSVRLFSIIFFVLGILLIFVLAKKFVNIYGAVLASFLFMCSHLNLSYATQAKPYMAIEVIILILVVLIMKLSNNKDSQKIFIHLTIVVLLVVSYLLQKIGVFFCVVYASYLLIIANRRKEFFPLLIVTVLFALLFIFQHKQPIFFNHTYQIVKLFLYKYSIITVCAILGLLATYRKNKSIVLALVTYIAVLLFSVMFMGYSFNIRYVLSLFGLMFLFFAIFWAKVGEKYFPKQPWIVPLVVMLLLYISGYKIVRWPQAYYNPNIDKYGDVQIANYKDFYAKLKNRFPNYQSLYVVNDIVDTDYWYFGRHSNAYFMKFTAKPYPHTLVKNAMVYGTLSDFKKIVSEHPQGLLIMEDWQSFLPDDIKEYAKKNLKLEYRVESLKEAPDDPWPLALYSWGFDEVKTLERGNVQTRQ